MKIRMTALGALALALGAAVVHAQSTPVWTDSYNGSASFNDWAESVAVDATGAVYATGVSFVEPQVGLFVPMTITRKYDTQGALVWSEAWGTGYYGGNGVATHIAIAPTGEVVVAGQRDLGEDWVLLRYDADSGVLLSEAIWLAGSTFVSEPKDMKISSTGEIYLAGDIGDPQAGATRAAVVKFDAQGAQMYAQLYNGVGLSIGSISSIALGPNGELYAAGGQSVTNASTQFAVTRLEPTTGAPLWINVHGQLSVTAIDYARDVEVAPNGDVVATGQIAGNTTQGPGITTVAYSSAGALVWRYDYNPTAFLDEYATELALDASGAAIVTGYAETSNNDFDALTLKISGGQLAWLRTVAGAPGSYDLGVSVDVDDLGSVYVFGTLGLTGTSKIFLRAYDASGALWRSSELAAAVSLNVYGGALRGDRIAFGGRKSSGGAANHDLFVGAFDRTGVATYCTAKVNSAGCTPVIAASGVPSLSSTSAFDITASEILNNRIGLLFYGTNGPAAAPFGGGTICVAQPVRRTPIQASNGTSSGLDCSGTYTFDFNALAQSGVDGLLVTGASVHAQYWYRDPASTGFIGLTDAVAFALAP